MEEDKVYVKVLDYKTGQTAFDLSLVYGGLQMQLLVYMEEALKIAGKKYPGREPVPAGVFPLQTRGKRRVRSRRAF